MAMDGFLGWVEKQGNPWNYDWMKSLADLGAPLLAGKRPGMDANDMLPLYQRLLQSGQQQNDLYQPAAIANFNAASAIGTPEDIAEARARAGAEMAQKQAASIYALKRSMPGYNENSAPFKAGEAALRATGDLNYLQAVNSAGLGRKELGLKARGDALGALGNAPGNSAMVYGLHGLGSAITGSENRHKENLGNVRYALGSPFREADATRREKETKGRWEEMMAEIRRHGDVFRSRYPIPGQAESEPADTPFVSSYTGGDPWGGEL